MNYQFLNKITKQKTGSQKFIYILKWTTICKTGKWINLRINGLTVVMIKCECIYSKLCFLFQQIAFKNLVQRNRDLEKSQGAPSPNSAIQLPYIIVNTSKKTVIDCSISKDKWVYNTPYPTLFSIPYLTLISDRLYPYSAALLPCKTAA